MNTEDYVAMVVTACKSLPPSQLRPVLVADNVLEQAVGLGYSQEDFSELRDIITGMAVMFLAMMTDTDTLQHLLEQAPAKAKLELVH